MNTITPIESPLTTLSSDEQHDLLARLLPTTRSGFGTMMTEDDVRAHLLAVDRTYLLFRDQRLVGFSSYNHAAAGDKRILYLSGIALDRSAHGAGIFNEVNSLALAQYNPDYFVMRTQNPVIYRGVEKLVDTIYPGAAPSPAHIVSIAQQFAGAPMEPDTHVVRGLYGCSLYDSIPEGLPARTFFDTQLRMNYARGDSVVIVGERTHKGELR